MLQNDGTASCNRPLLLLTPFPPTDMLVDPRIFISSILDVFCGWFNVHSQQNCSACDMQTVLIYLHWPSR